MKSKSFKKVYVLGVTIFFISIIVLMTYLFVFTKDSNPFEAVQDRRGESIENHKHFEVEKTENGTMIYSVGKVNHGKDNMYFVDMVKKSFIGYKWVGGGGHINRNIGLDETFTISAQLLNEDQNIRPTLFGIISDMKVNKINVLIVGDKVYEGIIYDIKEENEKFYYIPLDDNVSHYKSFIITVTYENGESEEYTVSADMIVKFKEGYYLYFR